MIDEIKDITVWEDAERWLSKHGFGLTQIEQQKVLWEAANVKPAKPVAVAKPVTTKAAKPAVNDQITDSVTTVDK